MDLLNIVWGPTPEIINIGGVGIRYYSLCWVIAFALGFYILKRVYEKENINIILLENLLIYIFIGSLVGARLGHCLFYDFEHYIDNPLEIILPFAINEDGIWKFIGYAGLASHGGVIGIIIAIGIYSLKFKTNVWDLLDKLALVGPLGGAFIRIGNFFNSEIIGKPTDSILGVIFKRVDELPRHASQLYEAFSYVLIFAIVYYIYNERRERHGIGFTFGVTILLVFVSRFIIEFSKIIQSPFEENLPIDMGQILSLPFIIAGLIVCFWKCRSKDFNKVIN